MAVVALASRGQETAAAPVSGSGTVTEHWDRVRSDLIVAVMVKFPVALVVP